ncbi:synaptic vesicular amine transporter-like [Diaphorina citri]|uniref:Synaptic vesicular amine transporter-like n=1 Tax=Diaphorina citri TaxID=121845 RepID=A0A3Q0IQN5_DIACI|nr:synaptic vesicular amine transporter-like [Diaphorina citri]
MLLQTHRFVSTLGDVVEIDKVGCFAIFDQEFGLVIEMFGFYLADINVIVVIVYLSMFLDNILLTVVVPNTYVGYPVGGFLYDFVNKAAPFVLIAVLVLVDLGLQLTFMNFKSSIIDESPHSAGVWTSLLSDHLILIILGSIWLSSSAMSILEPCLPIWLMSHVKPEKWQLGTVFIPDSVGYLVGTNFFGGISYRVGRWRVAVAAMLLVGVSCLLVPTATTMSGLIGPHLGLGLGINKLWYFWCFH